MTDFEFLPLGRPDVSDSDIAAVNAVLRSGWITTGKIAAQFEQDFAERVGASSAVAVASGTAGMHVVLAAMDIGPGDEVITPSLTWVSTINLITHLGATPVFADVDRDTLLLRAEDVQPLITNKTRAIIPVHFAGVPVDLDPLRELASKHNITLIEDAAHALGTTYKGTPIGKAGTSVFSFHPLKNITTGEGGLVLSDNPELLERIRKLKFHGIAVDAFDRHQQGRAPQAQVLEPGFKYNLPDMNAALGVEQLKRLDAINTKRAELAGRYCTRLADTPGILPLGLPAYEFDHSWSLFVVRVDHDVHGWSRQNFMEALKQHNIGSGIHFLPAHTHRYYAKQFPDVSLPDTEWNGERICSLPFYPGMTIADVDRVAKAIAQILSQSPAARPHA